MDPDSYHDGFLLASAIAVSEGLVPNRDFVAQYGPLTPLLQGAWVHLFGETVFVLRTLTALQLALIAFLIHQKIQSVFRNPIAIIITFAWVLGNPIDGLGSTMRPWPEITTTLLLLLMLNLIESNKSVSLSASILGVILAVITFNRINQVSIALAFFLFLLLFFRRLDRKWILLSVSFYSIGLMFSFLIMIYLGSFDDFIRQNIIYGFSSHHENGNGLRPAFNIRILFFGLTSYVLVQALMKVSNKGSRGKKFIIGGSTLVLTFSYFFMSGLVRNPEYQLRGLESSFMRNLKLIVENSPSFNIYAFCFLLIAGIRHFSNTRPFSRNEVSLGLALASLSSLYPTAAALKIWWVVPCAIYALPNLTSLDASWYTFIRKFTLFLVLPSLFALATVSYKYFSIDREPYRANVLNGTSGVSESRLNLDKNLFLLETNLGAEPARFECMRGIYSVFGGRYQSIDKHYVTFAPPLKDSRKNSKYIFFCDLDREDLSNLKRDSRLKIIYETNSEVPGLFNGLFVKISTTTPDDN